MKRTMSRQRDAECCEYREERRKLAAKKLRKKAKKKIYKVDDCNEDEEEMEEQRECNEKRLHKVDMHPKLISWMEEMMGRIKPSIEERDKYSMDHRHINCFLEPAQIEKLEYEEKMPKTPRGAPCDSYPRDDVMKKKKKSTRGASKKAKEKEDEKTDEEETKDVDDEKDNTESGPENVQQETSSKTKGEKKKPIKNEFWCPEAKKKKIDPSQEKDEIDCKDSICSFDSQINLSGSALTKNDMKKIAEIRRKRVKSGEQGTEKNKKVD